MTKSIKQSFKDGYGDKKVASKAKKTGSGNAKGGGKPSKPQDFYPNGALPKA